jgi:hypothetical protein
MSDRPPDLTYDRAGLAFALSGALACAACGGQSARDIPVCHAAWRELEVPAEYQGFQAHAAFWHDGRLYLRDQSDRTDRHLLIFEPSTRSFSFPDIALPPAWFPAALGESVFVFVGRVANARYDAGTDAWEELPPMPIASDETYAVPYGAAAMGDELFVPVVLYGVGEQHTGYYAFAPATSTWRELSSKGDDRSGGNVLWTGTEVIDWGGSDVPPDPSSAGARFDPIDGAWRPMSEDGAPTGSETTTLWTGQEAVVPVGELAAAYDPAVDEWRPLPAEGAPAPNGFQSGTQARDRIVVWGGGQPDDPASDTPGSAPGGGVYDPGNDAWSSLPTRCGPERLRSFTLSWVDDGILINSGQRFCGGQLCGEVLPARAWYLPSAAVFGEIGDPAECSCPAKL